MDRGAQMCRHAGCQAPMMLDGLCKTHVAEQLREWLSTPKAPWYDGGYLTPPEAGERA